MCRGVETNNYFEWFSPGIYFDEIGQVFFYPAQWKVVSYMNLKPTQMLWKQVKAQQLQIVNSCNKIHNKPGIH
jgi:hypothetical protein